MSSITTWYLGATWTLGLDEIGLKFVLSCCGYRALRKLLLISLLSSGPLNSLHALLKGLETNNIKLPMQGKCPGTERFSGFGSLPHSVPSSKWALRGCLVTKESWAHSSGGHKPVTQRNYLSIIYWAALLGWGSPWSPGWHIVPAHWCLLLSLSGYSECGQDYLGIPILIDSCP